MLGAYLLPLSVDAALPFRSFVTVLGDAMSDVFQAPYGRAIPAAERPIRRLRSSDTGLVKTDVVPVVGDFTVYTDNAANGNPSAVTVVGDGVQVTLSAAQLTGKQTMVAFAKTGFLPDTHYYETFGDARAKVHDETLLHSASVAAAPAPTINAFKLATPMASVPDSELEVRFATSAGVEIAQSGAATADGETFTFEPAVSAATATAIAAAGVVAHVYSLAHEPSLGALDWNGVTIPTVTNVATVNSLAGAALDLIRTALQEPGTSLDTLLARLTAGRALKLDDIATPDNASIAIAAAEAAAANAKLPAGGIATNNDDIVTLLLDTPNTVASTIGGVPANVSVRRALQLLAGMAAGRIVGATATPGAARVRLRDIGDTVDLVAEDTDEAGNRSGIAVTFPA